MHILGFDVKNYLLGIGSLYPFRVSEKDSDGKTQASEVQLSMHGFGIVSETPMFSRFFECENGGYKNGADVHEIRVRNNGGQWQDWQAFVGEISIMPIISFELSEKDYDSTDESFMNLSDKFKENFEIRKSGKLWSNGASAQILGEDGLIKEVDFSTLKVKYFSQVDNLCYPLESQIEDMVSFRKKYHLFDENDNRA